MANNIVLELSRRGWEKLSREEEEVKEAKSRKRGKTKECKHKGRPRGMVGQV